MLITSVALRPAKRRSEVRFPKSGACASKAEVRFDVNQSGCVSRHASGPIGVPEQLQLPGVGSS